MAQIDQGGFSMLVLTRKNGEGIWIGGKVEVKVLSIRGNRVKLGISAPAGIPITRDELLADSDGDSVEWDLDCGTAPLAPAALY
jgi:carbon storage regulator